MTIIEADARPEKRLFLEMFIRDLSLEDCVLDLIDNSIDSLIRNRNIDISEALLPIHGKNGEPEGSATPSDHACIKITYNHKRFLLTDTCGGISVNDAKNEVFRFGHSLEFPSGQLGVYGIGLKRAIFKIGNQIIIESKSTEEGFKTNIDVPKWAEDRFNWIIPLELINAAKEASDVGTSIAITAFNEEVSELFKSGTFEKRLYDRIARTYCLFLDRYVTILLNEREIDSMPLPLASSENVNVAKEEFEHGDVVVTLYAGLASRDIEGKWRADDAGWYAACNGRFVVIADKTDLTGWGAGRSPMFVPKYRGFVGIAFFYSKNALALPWTTTKRGLNRESLIYQYTRGRMANVSRPILSFLDKMYASEEIERIPQRQIAETITPVDIRKLTEKPSEVFIAKSLPPAEITVRVQYDAKRKELDRIKKHLRRWNWSAKRIGRFTFEHYLKTECPE